MITLQKIENLKSLIRDKLLVKKKKKFSRIWVPPIDFKNKLVVYFNPAQEKHVLEKKYPELTFELIKNLPEKFEEFIEIKLIEKEEVDEEK